MRNKIIIVCLYVFSYVHSYAQSSGNAFIGFIDVNGHGSEFILKLALIKTVGNNYCYDSDIKIKNKVKAQIVNSLESQWKKNSKYLHFACAIGVDVDVLNNELGKMEDEQEPSENFKQRDAHYESLELNAVHWDIYSSGTENTCSCK